MNTSSESDFASLPHPAQGRIDDLCDEFESELVAGRQTSIVRYLSEIDEASRETLFEELLAVELHHRGSDVGPVSPASYQTQFPDYPDAIRRAFVGTQSPFAPEMQVGDPRNCGSSGQLSTTTRLEPSSKLILKRHDRALEQHEIKQVSGDRAKSLWSRPEVKRARRRAEAR